MSKKIRVNCRDGDFIEYDLKIVIFRVFIFLILGFGIFFVFEKLGEKEKDFNLEEIEKEEHEMLTFAKNSRGDFLSLNEKVSVQGDVSISEEEAKRFLEIENFRITNNKNLGIYLSMNFKGKSLYKLRVLDANIGSFKFEIKDDLDFEVHRYILIRDDENSINYAYAPLG